MTISDQGATLPRMGLGQAISQEQKLDFLEYVRQGYPRPEAARKVSPDLTGSQFRKLCNPEGVHYDERFAKVYNEIMDSGEHEQNRLEMLQTAAFKRALLESDRLLEKLLLIHDPDWEVLRTQRIDVSGNMEAFVHQHFSALNSEQMKQLIAWVRENGEENILDAPVGHELEAA